MDGLYIAKKVLKEIREARTSISDTLMSGGIKDMAHYQFLVGENTGLSSIERFIKDLLRRNDERYEDDFEN
jgi:hypothetical protein